MEEVRQTLNHVHCQWAEWRYGPKRTRGARKREPGAYHK